MKKMDLLNLIRAHTEDDDDSFRRIANEIAVGFYESGDEEIARQISAYLSDTLSFTPQSLSLSSPFFYKVDSEELAKAKVFWPTRLYDDIVGVSNAIKRRAGVSKFLFYGSPGTGKTETAKIIASITKCDLWVVDFPALVDYRLGETSKNIADMFSQISKAKSLKGVIFLFDELDCIAMDRVNANDLREMGRATSAFLRGMDSLPIDACIIATTNLYDSMDKALVRRFDAEIDFDAYSEEDLIEVGLSIYNDLTKDEPGLHKDARLFRKIISLASSPILPGELKNIIRSCIAFGGDSDPARYLQLILKKIRPDLSGDMNKLASAGFTTREIALLVGMSKSTVSRRIVDDE